MLEVYHIRHRVYDPADGRWLQPDPIGHAGGWNLYEYGGGDYANTIDPWGLSPDPFEPNLNPTQSDYRGGFQDVVVDRGRDIFRRYYYRDGQVVKSVLWSVNGNKGSNFSGRQVFDRDPIGWFTTRAQAFAALNNVLQAASVAGHVVLVAEEMVLRIAVTPVDVVWSAAEIAQDPTNLWNWAGLLPVFSAGVKAVAITVTDAKGVVRKISVTEVEAKKFAAAQAEARTVAQADSCGTALLDDLKAAASRAQASVGQGKGPVHGARVHGAFESEVIAPGRDNVRTEVSYLHGVEVVRGTPGSVRLDVVEYGPNGQVLTVFDLKTGSAALTPARRREIQSHLPGSGGTPIVEIRP